MTDWVNNLNDAWNELGQIRPLARQYRSRLISTELPLEIHVGRRADDDAPCLMLGATAPPGGHFELGGMRLVGFLHEGTPILVLSLEDSARRDLFSTICADLVAAVALSEKESALEYFLSRLDAWRRFLRERNGGLTRPETIGLIGELLLLDKLLELDTSHLMSWSAPADGLHDFVNGGHALEVKTGLGPSAQITISRLDQLDTSGLRLLDLIHIKLIESPSGKSLQDVLTALKGQLEDGASRHALDNGIIRRGLLPDDDGARSAPRVQLRSMDCYAVSEGFPRLVRADLPTAITEASYTLEVRSIGPYARDILEVLAAFNLGEQNG
ncbi:PD-(D/E)XK motif protein [Rhizobium leguminosarum]|uniref:PD-(D/E)XK motif protein n=1 Tax=Rhizobium leguminosarum TaxID=384 RepID=UPI001C96F1C9|nr:PD-(D/E)XK motif protein [Rhizobium leguminosarum]MBY5549100.1 PD-(D/E)XK motif protein [Rhizobium leguminosarum]